jgi:hypothetical protein
MRKEGRKRKKIKEIRDNSADPGKQITSGSG